ncbi:MAG: TRAM domain-containing protein [Candidatus Eisenbacteria bacterium]
MSDCSSFEAVIEKIVTGGAGLARADGEIVFIAGVLPGERVRARVVRRAKGFLEAEAIEILDPSPGRVAPPEGPPGSLAGADFVHMSLAVQHEVKREIVRDCFSRIGKIDIGPALEGPEPAGPPWGYRNKIGLHGDGSGGYGMHRPGTGDLVLLTRNFLLPDLFHEEALPLLRRLPPAPRAEVRFDGRGRFLLSLEGAKERGGRLRTRVSRASAGESSPPGLAGVMVDGRAVRGEDHLDIAVGGRLYRVHGRSFFQVNLAGAETLVRLVAGWMGEAGLTPDSPGLGLLDLYGGGGLFAVAFADRFERTVLVESEGHAIRDARENARRAGPAGSRVEVIRSTVESALRRWTAGFPYGDPGRAVALVDPPRAGLAPPVLEALASLGPARLFYVSCDPATLARDCRILSASGYRAARVRLIDMFPQTSHVETATELVHARD